MQHKLQETLWAGKGVGPFGRGHLERIGRPAIQYQPVPGQIFDDTEEAPCVGEPLGSARIKKTPGKG